MAFETTYFEESLCLKLKKLRVLWPSLNDAVALPPDPELELEEVTDEDDGPRPVPFPFILFTRFGFWERQRHKTI
ncbi:hypothetical protein YC2023_061840 [Brassica napus]